MGLLAKSKDKSDSQNKELPKPDSGAGLKSRAAQVIERVELEQSLSLLDTLAEKSGHKKSLRERAKALLTFKGGSSFPPETSVVPVVTKKGRSLRERAREILQRVRPSTTQTGISPPGGKKSLLERARQFLGKKTRTESGGEGSEGTGPGGLPETTTPPIESSQDFRPDTEITAIADSNLPEISEPDHEVTKEEPDEQASLLTTIDKNIDLSQETKTAEEPAAKADDTSPTDLQRKLFENQIEQLSAIKQVMVQIGDNLRKMQSSFARFQAPTEPSNLLKSGDLSQTDSVVTKDQSELITPVVTNEPGTDSPGERQSFLDRRRGVDRRDPLNYTRIDPIEQGSARTEANRVIWPRSVPSGLKLRPVRMNADGTVSPVPGPLTMPHSPEEILGGNEQLIHFLRNLQNAEFFLADGEYQLSISIYKRLLAKIADENVKERIQKNIDSIEDYLKSQELGPGTMPFFQQTLGQSALEMAMLAETLAKSFSQALKEALSAIKEIQVESMNVHPQGMNVSIDNAVFDVKSATVPAGAGGVDAGGKAEVSEQHDSKDSLRPVSTGAETNATQAEPAEATPDTGISALGGADTTHLPEPGAVSDDTQSPAGGEGTGTSVPEVGGADSSEPLSEGVMDQPMIPPMGAGGTMPGAGGGEEGLASEKEADKVQEIRGVLELKTPDQEDTPFLTLTYDFTKIPHHYRLAKDHNIFEYAYYKYKHMLVKAHHFIKRKQITRALNYYRVIREQQIPDEFRRMIDRNIKDITEYLQKYLTARQG